MPDVVNGPHDGDPTIVFSSQAIIHSPTMKQCLCIIDHAEILITYVDVSFESNEIRMP